MKAVRSVLVAIYRWLSTAEPPVPAELIFVLAGRQVRKAYALELFRQGLAPRLLLSVGRFEIRRFTALALPAAVDVVAAAAAVPAPQRHFFVLFDGSGCELRLVPRRCFGTLGEIEALNRWLVAHPEITSAVIISSAPHLRRVRLCCRALMDPGPALRFVAVPDDAPGLVPDRWWKDRYATRLVLTELFKLLLYRLFLPVYRRLKLRKAGP